jgi:hypothetical protein
VKISNRALRIWTGFETSRPLWTTDCPASPFSILDLACGSFLGDRFSHGSQLHAPGKCHALASLRLRSHSGRTQPNDLATRSMPIQEAEA